MTNDKPERPVVEGYDLTDPMERLRYQDKFMTPLAKEHDERALIDRWFFKLFILLFVGVWLLWNTPYKTTGVVLTAIGIAGPIYAVVRGITTVSIKDVWRQRAALVKRYQEGEKDGPQMEA